MGCTITNGRSRILTTYHQSGLGNRNRNGSFTRIIMNGMGVLALRTMNSEWEGNVLVCAAFGESMATDDGTGMRGLTAVSSIVSRASAAASRRRQTQRSPRPRVLRHGRR